MAGAFNKTRKTRNKVRRVRPVRPRVPCQAPETVSWLRRGVPAVVWRMSRVVGVAPLVFTENGARVSRALAIYGRILSTIIIGLLIWFVYNEHESTRKLTTLFELKTTRCVFIFQYSLLMIMNFIAAFLAPRRINSLIDIVKRVQMVKKTFGELRHPGGISKREIVIIVLYCSVFIVINGCQFFVQLPFIEPQRKIAVFAMKVLGFWTTLIITTLTMQLTFTSRHVASTFPSFNQCLLQSLYSLDNKGHTATKFPSDLHNSAERPAGTTAQSAAATLGRLNTTYIEMYDLVNIVNDDGITMFLVICFYAFSLVITPYNFINKLMMDSISVPLLALEVYWIINGMTYLCLIVEPGHHVVYQTIKIKRTASKLMGSAMFCTNEVIGELNKLFAILMLIKPTFSALGMFTLSRKLIMAIVGAAVTYLVIVVQFRSSEK